jgi:hypothetical protein
MKEPVWFVHDDIAGVEGDNVSQWRQSKQELSRVELEALEIVVNGFEREQDRGLEAR